MKLLMLMAFYFHKLCDNEDKQRQKDAELQVLLTFKKLGILFIWTRISIEFPALMSHKAPLVRCHVAQETD